MLNFRSSSGPESLQQSIPILVGMVSMRGHTLLNCSLLRRISSYTQASFHAWVYQEYFVYSNANEKYESHGQGWKDSAAWQPGDLVPTWIRFSTSWTACVLYFRCDQEGRALLYQETLDNEQHWSQGVEWQFFPGVRHSSPLIITDYNKELLPHGNGQLTKL